MAIIKIKNQAIDLDAAEIPNLPATKITSGTFDNARISLDAAEIPNLDTAKITTGTLADARIPANALNSNIDLTNLSASNLTSGTVATARLGSGTADATTFLRGDNTFAEAGGGLVLLSSVSISGTGVYYINNVFSSTYRDYKIIGSGLDQATNNSKWLFFLNYSAGDDNNQNYWHGTGGYGNGSDAYQTGGYNVTDLSIIDATSNDNNGSTNFDLTLYRPNIAAYTAYTCIAGGRRHDGSGHVQSSGGYQKSTHQHIGIGFNVNQGQMSSGTLKIFGIKDS